MSRSSSPNKRQHDHLHPLINESRSSSQLSGEETRTSDNYEEKAPPKDYITLMQESMAKEESDNETLWLLSYADLMTLLFGFFVMLMSFSKLDTDFFEKARKETSRFFGGVYKMPLQKIQAELAVKVQQQQLAEQVHFDMDNKGLSVTFRGALFFDTASADLKTEAESLLRKILPVIKNLGPDVKIIVEGHTDDNPIRDERFPSNWELSSYRASTVLRQLESLGIPKTQLRAIGFGDSLPAFPNRDLKGQILPENQSKNRRVVLRIINAPKK